MSLAAVASVIGMLAVGPLESAAGGLGAESDYRAVEMVGSFGCDAVPLLVQQLEPVEVDQIDLLEGHRHQQAMRVIWSIAALRYITGKDFYADRLHSMDAAQVGPNMLSMGAPPGSIKFFGVWMSRGTIFFSSTAQQRDIIDRWHRYIASGSCERNENRDIGFWLYGVND